MKKIIVLLAIMLFGTGLYAALPGDSTGFETAGKISYKSGNTVKVTCDSISASLAVGQEGVLSKYFETELFGGTVTGWMSIGRMKVTAISNNLVTFLLLEELSVVVENGVKKNHFVVGKQVKFEWKVPSTQ